MSKYALLAAYLQEQTSSEVTLSFKQIEHIIGGSLPTTADKFKGQFWSNSSVKDGHPGRYWVDAGWRREHMDYPNRILTFRRTAGTQPTTLESIKPQSLENIYNLLERAGFSVEEWHRTSKGVAVADFRSNPRFCYNWCFGSVDEGFALCLWHGTLRQDADGSIYFDGNVREVMHELQRIASDKDTDDSSRSRAIDQWARAERLDKAIDESHARCMPVRAIICDGDRRRRDELANKASSVDKRCLDDVEWFVHEYESATGGCRIVRGIEPHVSSLAEDGDDASTYDVVQSRAIKTRRGQDRFRQQLLNTYRKSCAVTGTRITDLLEAAHIVPHSVVTDYSTRNGLLLRADIHTLFDVNLLSVDGRCTVHVSRSLQHHPEYWKFNGQRLKTVPERSEDVPSSVALEERHALFIEAERARS